MHLQDEQIQRILHKEIDAAEQSATALHLGTCAACSLRVEEASREEQWLFDRLRQLDAPAPVVKATDVVRRATSTTARWGRRAAAILLVVLGGGAAYAATGSPLAARMQRIATRWAVPNRVPSPTPVIAPEAPISGIFIVPEARFTIRFAAEQPTGNVTVRLTNDTHIAARALGGAATFSTDIDGVVIVNRGSAADYEIDVPRSASWVAIHVGERRLLLKDGARVSAIIAADSLGRYVMRLVGVER